MATLGELASVLRSKNAGALLITLDVMFEDEANFIDLKNSTFFIVEEHQIY